MGVEVPMKAGGFPAAGVTDAYEPLSLALVLRSEFGWPGRARTSHCWAVFPVAIGVPFPLSKLSCVPEMAGRQPATHWVSCCFHWGMRFLRTPHHNSTVLEAGICVCVCVYVSCT